MSGHPRGVRDTPAYVLGLKMAAQAAALLGLGRTYGFARIITLTLVRIRAWLYEEAVTWLVSRRC